MQLQKQVVLITGATGGLGSVLLDEFLAAGAKIAATSRASAELEAYKKVYSNQSERIRFFTADVTQPLEVENAVSAIASSFGKIDALIHTVGGFRGGKAIQDTPLEDLDAMLDLNLKSAFLCSKSVLPIMAGGQGGVIVTISALAGLDLKANRAAYAVSKSALVTLTQALALEGKSMNIRANTIAPSIIRTEANEQAMPEADFSTWVDPHDLAKMAIYLCTPEAQAITGTVVRMPGRV